jgi:hypothetical protein
MKHILISSLLSFALFQFVFPGSMLNRKAPKDVGSSTYSPWAR